MILKCIRELPSNATCEHFVVGKRGFKSLLTLLVTCHALSAAPQAMVELE